MQTFLTFNDNQLLHTAQDKEITLTEGLMGG